MRAAASHCEVPASRQMCPRMGFGHEKLCLHPPAAGSPAAAAASAWSRSRSCECASPTMRTSLALSPPSRPALTAESTVMLSCASVRPMSCGTQQRRPSAAPQRLPRGASAHRQRSFLLPPFQATRSARQQRRAPPPYLPVATGCSSQSASITASRPRPPSTHLKGLDWVGLARGLQRALQQARLAGRGARRSRCRRALLQQLLLLLLLLLQRRGQQVARGAQARAGRLHRGLRQQRNRGGSREGAFSACSGIEALHFSAPQGQPGPSPGPGQAPAALCRLSWPLTGGAAIGWPSGLTAAVPLRKEEPGARPGGIAGRCGA